MLKSDKWIIEQCEKNQLLSPFVKESVKTTEDGRAHVSHGPSSYGYDVRLDTKFKIFSNANQFGEAGIIDPTQFDPRNYIEHEGDKCIIPAGGFVLGVTKEYIRLPRDVSALVFNKSTYARCGISCLTTIAEAGWHGNLVLEFANHTPLPAILHANQGIAQLLFIQGDGDCDVSYEERGGKYQGQTGVQEAKC